MPSLAVSRPVLAATDGDCGHAASIQLPETEGTGDFELQPIPPMLPCTHLQTDTQALPVDATVLFVALQYQLLVAVEQCHCLIPGECLWIEAMGDVTVPGKTQIALRPKRGSVGCSWITR